MRRTAAWAMALVFALVLAGCASSTTANTANSTTQAPTSVPSVVGPTGSSVPTESPVPAESNPPGDIPDNTAFVPYTSAAGGWTVSVPEGWARTKATSEVTFTDKLNTVQVTWAPGSAAPTVASAKKTDVPTLSANGRAFKLVGVKSVQLPAGPAVLIEYQVNSDPNPVTGKQYRLDVQRYEIFRNGRAVAINLLSPVGADNVDPWRMVTESFKWS
jgi:hypothetical protein